MLICQTLGTEPVTRRKVHGLIGEWLGHLPVAGWLRTACGHLQHCSAENGIGWDEAVSEATQKKVCDVEKWLGLQGDPACGQWAVDQ